MQNRTTAVESSAKGHHYLVLAVMAGIVGIAFVSASGTADFSATSSEESSVGNVITSDSSFTFNNAGVSIATNQQAGAASSTSAQEITSSSNLRLRTNAVTTGHLIYSIRLLEASALTSGTWTIQIFQDGTQVGNTITVTQATAESGTTEGATIIADLGTSLPATNVFEVKVVKTA